MIDKILNFCADIYIPILAIVGFILLMIFISVAPNVFAALVIIGAFLAVVLGMLRAHHII